MTFPRIFYSLFCTLLIAQLQAQQVSILFKANMNYQIELGQFDPDTEFVDLAGTFNGWGSDANLLSDADGDRIYEVNVAGFSAQEVIEFKFRINGEWNGREEFPGGGANRKYTVQMNNNLVEVWYNDEVAADAPPQANFNVSMAEFYQGAIVNYTDASLGSLNNWSWTFEGGIPASSSEQHPSVRYPNSGRYGVSLVVGNGEESDTLTYESYVNVLERNTRDIPWWNNRVFYQIFVRSFYDSDGNGIGDFKGIIEKLDYLNDGDPNTTDDLGITGIWLMPIHPSPSYHGYDVRDYRGINPQYGSMDDFKEFLQQAQARGIRVIIDFVMNHSSSAHPWFINSASSSNAEKRNWYRWSTSRPNYNGPWGQSVWHNRSGNYYYGLFWSGMPDLNYEEEALKEEMFSVADFWLREIGIDGFRLDAVKFMIEENEKLEDTESTFQFWRDFRQSYKQSKADAFAVGEAWTYTEKVTEYVKNDGLDYCFEFDLAWNMLNAVNEGSTDNLYVQMQKVYNLYPHLQYGTFLSNHDQDRIMDVFGNQAGKVKVAAAIYLTLPGIPYIYYGEEIGMNGAKPDEFIRRPMQWTDGYAAGFTEGTPWINLNANYPSFNVENEAADPNSLLNAYKALIQLRNQEDALQMGTYEAVPSSGSGIFAFLRQYENETILVVVNTSSQNYSNITLDLGSTNILPATYLAKDLLANNENFSLQVGNDKNIRGFDMAGRSYKLFKFNQTTDAKAPFQEAFMKVYPNPVTNEMVVELEQSGIQQLTYVLHDLQGRRLMEGSSKLSNRQIRIDVANLPRGTYILRLSDDEFYAYRKVVKN